MVFEFGIDLISEEGAGKHQNKAWYKRQDKTGGANEDEEAGTSEECNFFPIIYHNNIVASEINRAKTLICLL